MEAHDSIRSTLSNVIEEGLCYRRTVIEEGYRRTLIEEGMRFRRTLIEEGRRRTVIEEDCRRRLAER